MLAVHQEGRVHGRTLNATFEGHLLLPAATRLKEFLNRPAPLITLTDVDLTVSPLGIKGSSERVPSLTVYKAQLLYITVLEELRLARGLVYERDVVAARLKKELFLFQLDAGVTVTGQVVGGEHTVVYHKGMFLAVVNPQVCTMRGTPLLPNTGFVLVNLGHVEFFRPLGESQGVGEQGAGEQEAASQETGATPELVGLGTLQSGSQ